MAFLRVGFLLLVFLRIAYTAKRWNVSVGEPVAVGSDAGKVKIIRGKHKVVNGVRLSLDVVDQFRFTFRFENSVDRFAKRFGIAQEWQTGDELFDERVFILSEDPTLLETLSSDKELRALIGTVLDFHVGGRLDCANGQLMFEVLVNDVDRDQSDEILRERFAREMLPALVKLRDRLARISAGSWEGHRDPALTRKAWLIGVSMLIAVTGIVGWFVSEMYRRHQIVLDAIPHHSAWATGSIAAALLGATFLWLGRSPHTHAVLLDVLLAAIPGAWLAANGGFAWYNEKFDTLPPTRYVTSVVSMYTTKHKSTTYYHLVVGDWPDARGNRKVEVSQQEWSLAYVGGCVVALWHPGRLGDGWVSGFESAGTEHCGRTVE